MDLGAFKRKLLIEAGMKGHGLVSFNTGYYTGRQVKPYGSRSHDAATALEAAGMLERHSQTSGVHHFIGNTSADHYTEHTFRITPAGREAFETLMKSL